MVYFGTVCKLSAMLPPYQLHVYYMCISAISGVYMPCFSTPLGKIYAQYSADFHLKRVQNSNFKT
jgi:hypothetical protein